MSTCWVALRGTRINQTPRPNGLRHSNRFRPLASHMRTESPIKTPQFRDNAMAMTATRLTAQPWRHLRRVSSRGAVIARAEREAAGPTASLGFSNIAETINGRTVRPLYQCLTGEPVLLP